MKLALLGLNIQHSLSKNVYEKLLRFHVDYDLIDVDILPDLYKLAEKYDAINVTAPFKTQVFNRLDIKDEQSTIVQSCNCFILNEGKLIGTNTDYLAMQSLLPKYMEDRSSVYILGSGAMARLTREVCLELDYPYCEFSRSLGNLQEIYSRRFDQSLVVNCCSRAFLFEPSRVESLKFFDLNYNNSKQKDLFVDKLSIYHDGELFLHEQAKHALNFMANYL